MLVKPEGKRKKSRPRIRWIDGVEKDLRDLVAVNWKTKAQERDGWRKYIKAGQHPQRFVVPIIMIIIIIIIIIMETDYWLDGRGSLPGRGKNFSSAQRSDPLWGPHSRL
jgi:hypothetical protein